MLAAIMLVPAAAGGVGIELPSWMGLIIALGTAGLIGLFNGFMVVRVGLNPFISTLGLLVLLRGGVLIISERPSVCFSGQDLRFSALQTPVRTSVSVIYFWYWQCGRLIFQVPSLRPGFVCSRRQRRGCAGRRDQ